MKVLTLFVLVPLYLHKVLTWPLSTIISGSCTLSLRSNFVFHIVVLFYNLLSSDKICPSIVPPPPAKWTFPKIGRRGDPKIYNGRGDCMKGGSLRERGGVATSHPHLIHSSHCPTKFQVHIHSDNVHVKEKWYDFQVNITHHKRLKCTEEGLLGQFRIGYGKMVELAREFREDRLKEQSRLTQHELWMRFLKDMGIQYRVRFNSNHDFFSLWIFFSRILLQALAWQRN